MTSESEQQARDPGDPAVRLGEAMKQIQIASEEIDDVPAVIDLAEAMQLIETVQQEVEQ